MKIDGSQIALMRDHVVEFASWFNEAAQSEGLECSLDLTMRLRRFDRVAKFDRIDQYNAFRHTRLSKEDVNSGIKAIARALKGSNQVGVVHNPVGKSVSGISLMMMYAAPIKYLQTGERSMPLYMTANLNKVLQDLQRVMWSFLTFYGDIDISVKNPAADDDTVSTVDDYYYCQLEENPFRGHLIGEMIETMTAKRLPGGFSQNLALRTKNAENRGHQLTIILDDALFPTRAEPKDSKQTSSYALKALKEIANEKLPQSTRIVGVVSPQSGPSLIRDHWTI